MKEKFIKISELERLIEDLKFAPSTIIAIRNGIKKETVYTAEGHWHTYVGKTKKYYKIFKEIK